MTASSNTMKYKEELYNLDPLHRMDNVPLFKDDGLVSNAKKYFILNLSSSSSSSDLYGILIHVYFYLGSIRSSKMIYFLFDYVISFGENSQNKSKHVIVISFTVSYFYASIDPSIYLSVDLSTYSIYVSIYLPIFALLFMYCCIYSGIESDDDMQNQILSCIDELGVKEVIKSLFLSMLCCV